MAKEIDICCYECDCGHQLNFCENTIREMKSKSFRKPIGIGEGDDRHAVIFHKGQFTAIFCPKKNADLPAIPNRPEPISSKTKRPYTHRQGQFLAFIHFYTKLHRQPPAEADFAAYFRLTPPSIHGMIVTLTRKGLIDRDPGMPRSIRLRIDPAKLPGLQ